MSISWSIKGGGYNLTETALLHLSDLLRTLVYEEDHEVAFRAVLDDALSNSLENHGFTCFRRCNYHGSLPLTKRTK